MERTTFESELRRVQTMGNVDPPNADYWTGYARGLRRGYYGERFGTEQEHALWLTLAGDLDPMRDARGRGYRDGLAATGDPVPETKGELV